MDASFFRDFAERVRDLMKAAPSDPVRQQLGIWAEEIEQQAEALEGEFAGPSSGLRKPAGFGSTS